MAYRSDSPLYNKHYHAYRGCTDPNSAFWRQYGARGIKMYKPWASLKYGFDRFEAWVLDNLGPQPHPDSILKRIKSTGDFKPGNLEWSTWKEMSNSRVTNHLIKINGKKLSLSQAADEYNINYATLFSRVNDYGVKPSEAVKNPRKPR